MYDNSEARLRELILYIADQSVEDRKFGATKLNKILFFSDFLAYGEHGEAITGVTYVRLPFGPVPDGMAGLVEEMVQSGEIVIREKDVMGRTQKQPIPTRKPDLSLFTAEQIVRVNSVIASLWNHTAKSVSDLSHEEFVGWQIASNGTPLPYESVFLSIEPLTEADIARGQELAGQYGWLA